MSIFKNRMAAKYKKVFDNADGQTVLADLMRRAGMVGKVAATKTYQKANSPFGRENAPVCWRSFNSWACRIKKRLNCI